MKLESMGNEYMGKPRFPVGAIGFMGLAFFIGGLLVIITGIVIRLNISKARKWEEIPVSLTKLEITARQDEDDTVYSVETEYSYRYGGKEYTSDSFAFSGGDSRKSSCEALIAFVKLRNPLFCYVNPEEPDKSVLYRESLGVWSTGVVMGLMVLLIGAVMLYLSMRAIVREEDVEEI
ncbi:MAG: DUF3592 domain-containing protein [Planctomycetota bacterium]|jgi:hypothetical protein